MPSRRVYPIWVLCAALMVGFAKFNIDTLFQWRFPPLDGLVVTDEFLSDLGSIFLGSHRIAVDLAYIQFLQYYGPHDHLDERPGSGHNHEDDHADPSAVAYPLVKTWGDRMLAIDPFFNAPILEFGGVLAFNHHRVDESLALLKKAAILDPSFYRYQIYIAAILYKNEGKDAELIQMLKEAIKYRDCPALLQNVLGNLLKKRGDYIGAADVYIQTIKTAPYPDQKMTAQTRLTELIAAYPQVRPHVAEVLDQK